MRGPAEIIASFGLPPATGVLQIGANTGQEIPYFLAAGITHGALIEPLDGPFGVLRAKCAGLPGFLPIQALVGSRDGDVVDFYIASNNGESSSLFKPTGHLVDYPQVEFAAKARMHTFSLDRIFASVAHSRPEIAEVANLLFMDVQGAEVEVLKGANATLAKIDYIYTEIGLGGGYDGDGELLDVMHLLKVHGFSVCELEVNGEGWGNAMFIRRSNRRWGRGQAAPG